MEFWPQPLKYLNSGLFLLNIGILVLSFLKLKFCPILQKSGILTLSFQTFESWPNPFKHCYSETFEFWSYPSKHWISALILWNIGMLALFFQTLEFWFILPNIRILTLSIQTFNSNLIETKYWNSCPNFGILT